MHSEPVSPIFQAHRETGLGVFTLQFHPVIFYLLSVLQRLKLLNLYLYNLLLVLTWIYIYNNHWCFFLFATSEFPQYFEDIIILFTLILLYTNVLVTCSEICVLCEQDSAPCWLVYAQLKIISLDCPTLPYIHVVFL